MAIIQIKDKRFQPYITEDTIQREIKRVAGEMNRDLQGKNPLLLGVLNGAFMFAADLMKNLTFDCQISFVKMSSYAGTATTGSVTQLIGINDNIKGRTVVIVEDIVDTGYTMRDMLDLLKPYEPAEVYICTLALKPSNLKVPLDMKYVALTMGREFVVGYGFDYDGYGRNYRDIYKIVE